MPISRRRTTRKSKIFLRINNKITVSQKAIYIIIRHSFYGVVRFLFFLYPTKML